MEQQAAYFDRLFKGIPFRVMERGNVRPTTLAMTLDAEGWVERHWSLLPAWAKEPKLKFATFNARAETVTQKPAFRGAWKRSQRCIVPASAYAEWPTIDGKKQRHRVQAANGAPLLFGGLWELWQRGQEERHSFTILTVPPVSQIEWLHHRMPLILPESVLDAWLHASPEECEPLLSPQPVTELSVTAV